MRLESLAFGDALRRPELGAEANDQAARGSAVEHRHRIVGHERSARSIALDDPAEVLPGALEIVEDSMVPAPQREDQRDRPPRARRGRSRYFPPEVLSGRGECSTTS